MIRRLRASAPVTISTLLLVLTGCGSQTKTVVETVTSTQTNYGEATSSTSTSATSPPSAPGDLLTPRDNPITVEFGGFRYQIEYTGVSTLRPSMSGSMSAQPGYTYAFAQIRVTNLQTDRPVPYGRGSFVHQFIRFYGRRQVMHPPIICGYHVSHFCEIVSGSELSDNSGQPGENLDGSTVNALDAGGQDTVWIVGGPVKEGTHASDLALVAQIDTQETGFQIVGRQQPFILAE
jgi:hypothetical protein